MLGIGGVAERSYRRNGRAGAGAAFLTLIVVLLLGFLAWKAGWLASLGLHP